jgi:hypothetical protein
MRNYSEGAGFMERRGFLKNSLYAPIMRAIAGEISLLAATQPKGILELGDTSFLGQP